VSNSTLSPVCTNEGCGLTEWFLNSTLAHIRLFNRLESRGNYSTTSNKCIGDNTKAAARQSLTCIKNKKINKIWRKTIFNMADGILTSCNVARSWHWFRQVTAPCNVACGSRIVTVNSASGSTLQCDTWLWDDMPLNSPIRAPYWNSTSGFDFDHITTVDMSFCTSLRHFIQIGPPSAEKNDVMSIFKMADLSHLGFYGSNNGFFEKPMYYFL